MNINSYKDQLHSSFHQVLSALVDLDCLEQFHLGYQSHGQEHYLSPNFRVTFLFVC